MPSKTMRTERQIEASRRNGAKSRGPVTAALKAEARQAPNSPQPAPAARQMLFEQNEPGIPLKTKGRA